MPAEGAAAVNPVGFTSQITAAFRAVELAHNPSPIIVDQLAAHLGKAAYDIAYADWQQLVQAQGEHKSLRVPARNRLMDDMLLHTLQQLPGMHSRVQVVNLGCGMDSKPWRLRLPQKVSWFDVDQPAVIQLKQQLLQQAGAETIAAAAAAAAAAASAVESTHHSNTSSGSPATGSGAEGSSTGVNSDAQQAVDVKLPLVVGCWQPVAADLSEISLQEALAAAGFSSSLPTVWLAEALLYYLPLDPACSLLSDMRSLSGPGSKLIATCIDRELFVADHERLQKGHYFHAMWYFCIDDLMQDEQQRLKSAGWLVDMQPMTTSQLALERYGRDTYVALYGGAECVFSAYPA